MANEATKPAGQGNTETTAAAAGTGTTGAASTGAAAGTTAAGATGTTAPAGEGTTGAAATAGTGTEGTTAADPQKVVPEKYDLKLPEGDLAVYADQSTLDSVAAIAKAEGWSNEEAQQRVQEYAEAYKAQADSFLVTLKADPDYGGEKLEQTQKLARAVLEKVRPANTPRGKALRRILDQSGYGNHIEIVSFLADLGKMTGEDTAIVGDAGSGGGGKKDPAEVLYGAGASQ